MGRRVRFRAGRCKTGKKRWPSESAAHLKLLEVQNLRREQGSDRVESRIYRCPYCDGWHLTSMIPKEDEQPRR